MSTVFLILGFCCLFACLYFAYLFATAIFLLDFVSLGIATLGILFFFFLGLLLFMIGGNLGSESSRAVYNCLIEFLKLITQEIKDEAKEAANK